MLNKYRKKLDFAGVQGAEPLVLTTVAKRKEQRNCGAVSVKLVVAAGLEPRERSKTRERFDVTRTREWARMSPLGA